MSEVYHLGLHEIGDEGFLGLAKWRLFATLAARPSNLWRAKKGDLGVAGERMMAEDVVTILVCGMN